MTATKKSNRAARVGNIFLSHAGADTVAARHLADTLRRRGLSIWFDQDSLKPGDEWQTTIENALVHASAMIVYVGTAGIQTFVDREVRFGLLRNTYERGSFRFIPVLGDGADPTSLPPFVRQHQYVDLRDARRAPAQIRRLVEILQNETRHAAIPDRYWIAHSPFRSLQSFGPEDSWLFFGRDRDTDEILARLGRAPTLALVGNSGSGKSSLINAGLIPALRSGRLCSDGTAWRIASFRPSIDPFDYLAKALPSQLNPGLGPTDRAEFIDYCKRKLPEGGDALSVAVAALLPSSGTRALLVADQFEELVTLVTDKFARKRYIDLLLAAARLDGAVPIHLVIALRADFYANCLDYPNLSAALSANLYNVPVMSSQQLRDAIENRLALAGATAEAGLIDIMLADVGDEPGNLALLEHALAQLWNKRAATTRTLTNQTYFGIGQLKGALGRHADEIYRDLGEDDRNLAKRILLELVQLGEEAQDTRRWVPKESLFHIGPREEIERLIAHLASSRLVATSENFVEVSHEALIREWPTLRDWLEESRADLLWGRRLLQSAEEWHALGRDHGALLAGVRLARGEEWRKGRCGVWPLLQEFLDASLNWEQEESRRERENQERDEARSREFAAQSGQILSRDQPAALDFAIRGWRVSKTTEANLAMARSFAQLLTETGGQTGDFWHVSLSPDGKCIFTGDSNETRGDWHATNNGLLTALTDDTDTISQMAFKPHGRQIVAATYDLGTRVCLWNAVNGRLLVRLNGIKEAVWQAAFSWDCQRVVTTSGDTTARLWNAATGELLETLEGHTNSVFHAAFSINGQLIVTASADNTARLWDTGTGKTLATLGGHTKGVFHAAFSPDDQRIITSGADNTARVWDVKTSQLLAILEGHTNEVMHAAFSPGGQRIVTASADNTARVWDVTTGKLLVTLEGHTESVLHAAFSSDGQLVVTGGSDGTARVWNPDNGQLLAMLEGHTESVVHAAFLPDGQRIVTNDRDYTVRVWNLIGVELLASLLGHSDIVLQAAFSPDGQRIVTASADHVACVWNSANGQLLTSCFGHTASVCHAAFSSDGLRVITTSDDKTVRLWNATTGQPLGTLEHRPTGVEQAAFSPDGLHIVTASANKTARLWKSDGQRLAVLKGHGGKVCHVGFSPDGLRIVTASADKAARLWNCAGQLLAVLKGHRRSVCQTAFSVDGLRIVTASADKTARVWSATDGQMLAKLVGHTDSVEHAAFSPDGRRVVTASWDMTARVWNADNGQLLASLIGHTAAVLVASFSPDGQRVITVAMDGTAQVWNPANGQLLALLVDSAASVTFATFSPDGQRIVATRSDKSSRVYRLITLSEVADLLAK